MMQEPPPLNAMPYKDRKTGLLVFGIIEILLGAFFALSLLGTIFAHFMLSQNPEVAQTIDRRSLLPAVLTMGGMVCALVWLGVGSIKARRWARTLNLCLGWMGLVVGIGSCVALIWTLPGMDVMMRQNAQQAGQEMPEVALMFTKIAMVVFAIVFYIVIPGAFVLFYRSEHVKLTCEARDPVPRWTDRCPLPVLSIVLVQVFAGASMLTMLPLYGRAFPFFGFVIKGLPATAIYLGFAGFSLYVAQGFFRLSLRAYWIYFVVMVVFMLSGIVTFSGSNLIVFYQAIDLPKAQLQQIEQMPMMHSQAVPWMVAICAVLYAGFLFWLKRFFVPAKTQ